MSILLPVTRLGNLEGVLVRKGGLEPPWVAPPDPKSGASANSATFALRAKSLVPLIIQAVVPGLSLGLAPHYARNYAQLQFRGLPRSSALPLSGWTRLRCRSDQILPESCALRSPWTHVLEHLSGPCF